MKKIIIVFISIIFFISLFINNNSNEEIRVRIVPNSNNIYDKEIKEDVKKIVIGYLASINRKDYNECLNNIKNNLYKLEDLLIDYNCKIDFEYHTLYNKTYNDNAIKDENAYTLYVVIGEGNGSNWWGTIYPSFLGISSEEEIKYKSFFYELFNKGDIS